MTRRSFFATVLGLLASGPVVIRQTRTYNRYPERGWRDFGPGVPVTLHDCTRIIPMIDGRIDVLYGYARDHGYVVKSAHAIS